MRVPVSWESHSVSELMTWCHFLIFFCIVVNFFLVEAETRRRWDIFQAEVTLYWELAVRRCSHPSLTIAQHSRVYTFQGGGIHRGGDNLNKACKCSTGISPLPEFPSPDLISITVSFKCIGANPISLTVLPIPSHYHRDKGTFNLGPCTMVRKCIKTKG